MMPERSRERVAEILQHRGDGCVAYDALRAHDVFQAIDSLDLSDEWRAYFREGEFRYVSAVPSEGNRAVFAEFMPDLPPEAKLSCWGVGSIALRSVEGHHAGHKYWRPLGRIDSVQDLESYPFPDLTAGRTLDDLRKEVDAHRRDGFTVIGQMSQTIFETACLMRGMDQLMIDFYERPDYVDFLFARMSERRAAQARMFARAGVDVLRIGDDIATQEALMVGPAMYRERIKPHHAAAIAAAREVRPGLPVLYHSDGRLTELLPDLIEIGVTAINPVQPECMDLMETKQRFGDRLTLWGCMPVQSLYAHGSPDDIRRNTRLLLAQAASGHGLIIQFINIVLTPKVLANLRVFFEEFADIMKT
ncbi:MAG: uroporphyrinogen decarboxylase family protein [Planctomycetota bacterium]